MYSPEEPVEEIISPNEKVYINERILYSIDKQISRYVLDTLCILRKSQSPQLSWIWVWIG